MTTIFVTSSGTGIGKTFVTLRLIAELKASGKRVQALKPVASGFDAARPGDGDTGALLRALELEPTAANLDAVSPWRFAAPLSPDMAAARERRTVPFDALVAHCRAAGRRGDVTLIEGIGGVMVPLDAEHTVLDWVAALEVFAFVAQDERTQRAIELEDPFRDDDHRIAEADDGGSAIGGNEHGVSVQHARTPARAALAEPASAVRKSKDRRKREQRQCDDERKQDRA